MKKFLIMSAMVASLIAVAGPKKDLDSANKLFAANKIEDGFKILKSSKLVKGEEKEYEQINFFLAQNAKTQQEAISYLKKITANKKSNSEFAIQANNALVSFAKTNKEKIALLEELQGRINSDDLNTMARLSYLYTVEKNTSKAREIDKKVSKKPADFVAWFNLSKGLIYLNEKDTKNGMVFINKAINSKIPNVVAESYLTLATFEKDQNKAASLVESAKKANSTDPDFHYRLYNIYLDNNMLDIAYDSLKKAYSLDPKNVLLLNELFSFTNYTKSKDEAKYVNELRTKYKANDLQLAAILFSSNIFEGALDYAKKSTDKNSTTLIAVIYAKMGNKKEALKYAEKAVKDKLEGAEDLLQQIKAMPEAKK